MEKCSQVIADLRAHEKSVCLPCLRPRVHSPASPEKSASNMKKMKIMKCDSIHHPGRMTSDGRLKNWDVCLKGKMSSSLPSGWVDVDGRLKSWT